MKKVFLFLSLFLVSAFLVGCFEPKNIVSSIEVVSDETEFDQGFQLSDLDVKVTMSDGTFSFVPLNESMISADDLAKFQTEGTHTIAVSYLNAATTFTISISGEKGDPGENGKAVLLRVEEGYIQWQYEGDTTWTNLIALSALMGATGATGSNGTNGTDGKPTAFRVEDGFIQWQYVGDATWTNLLATADLVGLTGATGPAGTNGTNGTDGKQVTFQVTAEYIQWQYVGDTTWTNLIALSALRGPAGADGADGADGEDGVTPTIGISEDGYWVINGVKTTYKASGESVAPILLNVTFDTKGGTLPEGTPATLANIEKGSTISLPLCTKEGYIFDGWWTGDTVNDGKFTNATPVTKDITLYARWITNYEPIQTFLAIPATTNFTASSIMVADIVWGNMAGRFENNFDFKVYEEAGIIYTYEESFEKTFQNGVINPEETFYREEFLTYLYGRVYSLERNEENGQWLIDSWSGNYQQEFPFGFINPFKFVKREGVNIYDYPLTQQELMMVVDDMNMGGGMTVLSNHCYLDLDAYKLVIAFNIEAKMEDGTMMTGQISMEVTLSDPGLTTIELPLADTKAAAIDMVNQTAAAREEINFAKPESVLAFNSLVDSIKTKINAATTIVELMDLLQMEIPKIHTFPFEIDQLAQEKFYRIDQMMEYLEGKLKYATPDSITAMQAIFDTEAALLNSAISSEQITVIFNAYFGKIDAAYVFDPAKAELERQKEFQIDVLTFFMNTLPSYLGSPSDYDLLEDTFNQHKMLIEQATTLADVELLYNQAIAAFKALPLSWQPNVDELPTQLINQLNQFINNAKQIIGDNPDIQLQTQTLIDLIKAQVNPMLMVDVFVAGYLQIQEAVTEIARIAAYTRLIELQAHFAAIVIDEDLALLWQLHVEALNEINQTHDFWAYMDIVNQFEWDCLQYLQFDSLKLLIADLIENLLWEFNLFSQTASADSIVAMQAVVDANVPIIEASADEQIAETNYFNAYQALKAAYVLDPIKEQLMIAKDQAITKMYDLTYYLGQLLPPDIMDQVWGLHYQFSGLIENVLTVEAIEPLYNEWYAKVQLVDLTAGEYPLTQMKKTIMQQANELHEVIITTVDPLPENFQANFDAFVAFFNSTTNVLELYNIAKPYIEGLEALAVDGFRNEKLAQLLGQFYYFASLIYDADLPALQTKYDESVVFMNQAVDRWVMENILYDFVGFGNGLGSDPIKYQRLSFINDGRSSLDSYLETATAESIIAMNVLFDAFVADINVLTEYSAMQNRTSDFFNALYATYVPDYDKLALKHAKFDCMNKLYEFVWSYVYQVSLDPSFADQLSMIVVQNKYMIFEATTLQGAYAACQTIMDMINKPFEVDPNKVGPFKEYLIAQVHTIFNDIDAYLMEIPVAFSDMYFAVLPNIEGTTNPSDMFNYYTTFTSNLKQMLMAQYQLEKTALALQYKEDFASTVLDENVPLVEQAYLDCLAGISHAIVLGDVNFAVDSFYDYISSLWRDDLKVAIADGKNYVFNGVNHLLLNATSESLALMQAEIAAFILEIEAATDSDEAWTIAYQAHTTISELYLRDFVKYNLEELKDKLVEQLSMYIYNYFYSLYADWDYYYPLKNIYISYQPMIEHATTAEEANSFYQVALGKMNLIQFVIDESELSYYYEELLGQYDNFYYWATYSLTYIPTELESIYDNGRLAIQNAPAPLDALMLFFTHTGLIDQLALEQEKIEQMEEITVSYNYYHLVAADADIPGLEQAYALVQAMFNQAVDTASLDYASLKFYTFMNPLALDSLKLTKYNRAYDLKYYHDELIATATADSITALASLLVSHTNNIYNATTPEDVEAAYGAGYDALLGAFVEDPEKVALFDAQTIASDRLYEYVSFMIGFIPDWELHHQLWDICYTYSDNIFLTDTITQIDTLYNDGIAQMKTIEVLDTSAVNDFRNAQLTFMTGRYQGIESPTTEQTDTYNDYSNLVTNEVHPWTINLLVSQFISELFVAA